MKDLEVKRRVDWDAWVAQWLFHSGCDPGVQDQGLHQAPCEAPFFKK